ncbi:MAG: GspE/PulE family protein [Patescibacteria group bacterium]
MYDIKIIEQEILKQLKYPSEKVSVVKLVDLIIEYAYVARASDVHMDPDEKGMRIRFRIDGNLTDMFPKNPIPKDVRGELVARIKVVAGLRTDEHLVPQDGRFRVTAEVLGNVDVRVSIIPTYYGENIVMRILAANRTLDLETQDFSPADLRQVLAAIKRPYGMILANGPTGSGKTTTLYSILRKLNKPEVSIITIEDPIEYSLEGTTQIQVNTQVGLTFASGLRSILRQDPNIVMVGEIRDEETARIAVNAALTGHLVLSTLHTNDSATTFPRLMDMGIPPFLVASTVNIAMGQRLVRRLCPDCKKKKTLTIAEVESLGELIPYVEKEKRSFYAPVGCASCGNTGYKGRLGIREALLLDDEIRELVMQRSSAQDIKEAAVKGGMTTMLKDGLEKALEGLTSIDEVLRIIHE